MKGYTPGLFDRLLGLPNRGSARHDAQRLTAEELKDTVARDLEALLNTRSSIPEGALEAYPECSRSMVTYGLNDFADRCLSSPTDRADICASIENTISRHEPRLRNVRASLDLQGDSVNRLNFSITAVLVASTAQEPVNFDAVLTPSTLQYSISKAGKPARAGGGGA
ncbi:type VI secretion system baseplate subunit TssE [uncultured Massilia sp.]|uniref:type VI secretion system baseplate subunit TssE n=1 Tax=uncultured Massilia sp. TaxID=169973 RepID=UPI00258D94CE|nr:type VI secretion system baseplate subunit TssE [uncultured Massilia sp.]